MIYGKGYYNGTVSVDREFNTCTSAILPLEWCRFLSWRKSKGVYSTGGYVVSKAFVLKVLKKVL